MGFVQKLVLGRWFTRWLLRGGPWAIAAKLAAVAVVGAWRWRREHRRAARAERSREISASYEVLGPEPLGPGTATDRDVRASGDTTSPARDPAR